MARYFWKSLIFPEKLRVREISEDVEMSPQDSYFPIKTIDKDKVKEYLKVESKFMALDGFYKDPKNVEIRRTFIQIMLEVSSRAYS